MIIEKVKKTIDHYSMLRKGEKVLIACSGGPDSIALLYILYKLSTEYNIPLVGFHLNHRLRGEEADRDQRFVERVFKKLKLPLIIRSYDVYQYAKERKLSIEQGARDIRYKLLEEVRGEMGADKIALGHTSNDNLETIILHLVRGAGMQGLSGISPKRDRIIRPLINIKREEVLEFLRSEGIRYRIDRTNRDTKIPRNLIRLRVIPLLLKLNPKLVETVTRTTRILREEDEFIKEFVDKALKELVIKRDENGLWVDIRSLFYYNLIIKRRIIRNLIHDLDLGLIDRVLELMEGKSGKLLKLPKGLVAIKEYDRFYLGKWEKPPEEILEVKIGEVTPVKGWGVIRTEIREDINIENKKGIEVFDFDKIDLPLFLRKRKPGDRFQPFGLSSSKKLKEVMIDDKIPKRLRDYPILLCDKKGILLILGSRRSNLAKVGPKTKRFLVVEVEGEQ